MNQKDYKEIAGIIKRTHLKTTLSNELADCFERNSKDCFESGCYRNLETQHLCREFNRKQFLKDCGIQ